MNFRDDSAIMPDDELRIIYKNRVRSQKFVSYFQVVQIFPMAVIYGFLGWSAFVVSLHSQFSFFDTSVVGFIDFLAFAVCGVLLTTKNEKTFFVVPFVYVGIIALKYLFYQSLTGMSGVLLCLTIVNSYAVKKIVNDLNFLRGLPNFPFLGRKNEVAFEAMPRDKMLEYFNHQNNGGTYSTDYDKIFDADNPEDIIKPKQKTEEYLQQHKVNYKK